MSDRPRDLVIAQIRHRDTAVLPFTIDIEKEVALRLDAWYGSREWRGGGFILAPSKGLMSGTPTENAAVVEAFLAQGGVRFDGKRRGA